MNRHKESKFLKTNFPPRYQVFDGLGSNMRQMTKHQNK